MACAPGIVVECEDGLPDNPEPFNTKLTMEHISKWREKCSQLQLGGGNYVLIDHGHSEYLLYVHLKCDSVSVKKGDSVHTGDLIGKCGNSGCGSLTPHLHLQLMDNPVRDMARGMPITFHNMDNTIFSDTVLEKLKMPDDMKTIMKYGKAMLVKSKNLNFK